MANIVIVLVIVALAAIVSVQNATPVAVTFLFWKVETPLVVVIALSIFAGLIIAAVAALSVYMKKRVKNKKIHNPPEK